jgi:4-hydroxy-L-threonine phosphate dehydrogenase PdxA
VTPTPVIGITMGRACDADPEIILRALMRGRTPDGARFLVFSDRTRLSDAAEICRLDAEVVAVDGLSNAASAPGVMSVDHSPIFDIAGIGTADQTSMIKALRKAVTQAQRSGACPMSNRWNENSAKQGRPRTYRLCHGELT